MKYKVCSKCRRILLANTDNFHKNKNMKDGFLNACKECRHAENKTYYKANQEREKERVRVYRETNKNYVKEYNSSIQGKLARLNSHSRNRFNIYIHNITLEMYEDMIQFFDGKCAYTNVVLNADNFSFEHVVPSKGHCIWNIVPCNRKINSSKQDNDLLEWYPTKDYYSEERLAKIFAWLEYAYIKYN